MDRNRRRYTSGLIIVYEVDESFHRYSKRKCFCLVYAAMVDGRMSYNVSSVFCLTFFKLTKVLSDAVTYRAYER